MAKATKKANGDGTLSKRLKDGKLVGWKGAVSVGYKADGKPDRRWVSGKTRDEVKAKMTALEGQKRGGMLAKADAPKVADYLDRWLEHISADGKAYGTMRDYRRVVEKRLKPRLGRFKLDKLNVLDVQGCVNGIVQEVSPSEAARALKLLKAALTQARVWQIVPRNVAEDVKAPKVLKVEMKFWEASEASRFLEYALPHRLYAAFYAALTLGLRSGELRGLRWQDVDFTGGWLNVRQKASDQEHGEVVLEATLKTDASKRRIKLEPVILGVLEGHRGRQAAQRQQINAPSESVQARRSRSGLTRVYQEHDLVFPSEIGTPMSGSNLRREFNPLCDGAGVKRIRLHDLRHTAATAMVRRGYPPKLVADILGHTDPAFTLREYAHVWEEQREELAPSAHNLYGYSSETLTLN